LGINPPPKNVEIPISLNYPDTIGLVAGKTGLSIMYDLKADRTIAEGTNVSFAMPIAQILSTDYRDVTLVFSGFEGTIPSNMVTFIQTGNMNMQGGVHAGLLFSHVDSNAMFLQCISDAPFTWITSGDYSPELSIQFANGTIIDHTYDQIKVHVGSYVEIQDLKISKIELALTYALLVFGCLEAISIVHDLLEENPNRP
jgi:hypothetical protein